MSKKRTKAEQAELLNRPVEDFKDQQVVKDLMSEDFAAKSDLEALDVTKALAELIRGQKFMTEEVQKMRERMDIYDRAAQAFNEDRENFIKEVLQRAEKLKDPSGKTTAMGALELEKKIQEAKAGQVTARLKFEQDLANMPKVTVTGTGVPETMARTGQIVIMPEVIRIRHKQWVLQPGIPTEVPKIVADRYRQILTGRQEMLERQALLQANLKDTELQRRMMELNEKYKTNGDAIPIGSTAL